MLATIAKEQVMSTEAIKITPVTFAAIFNALLLLICFAGGALHPGWAAGESDATIDHECLP